MNKIEKEKEKQSIELENYLIEKEKQLIELENSFIKKEKQLIEFENILIEKEKQLIIRENCLIEKDKVKQLIETNCIIEKETHLIKKNKLKEMLMEKLPKEGLINTIGSNEIKKVKPVDIKPKKYIIYNGKPCKVFSVDSTKGGYRPKYRYTLLDCIDSKKYIYVCPWNELMDELNIIETTYKIINIHTVSPELNLSSDYVTLNYVDVDGTTKSIFVVNNEKIKDIKFLLDKNDEFNVIIQTLVRTIDNNYENFNIVSNILY